MRHSARAEWEPRNEGDSVLRAIVYDILPFAIGEAVAVLDGNDGNDFAGALHMLAGNIREADETNLALLAQLGERFHRFLERNLGIRCMQLIHVDALAAATFQRSLNSPSQVCGTGVVRPLVRSGPVPAPFGGDDQTLGIRRKSFGDQLFA